MAAKVGFDLYMKMLKKSIRQLRGLLDLPSVVRTNVLLDNADVTKFYIPEDYISDPIERNQQEGAARLAENTNKIVKLTHQWKDTYGPLPPVLQSQLKILHLHSCTRILGIDIVGKPTPKKEDENEVILLRAPGLRPRHWAMICQSFNATSPPGLNVHFPKRFTGTYSKDVVIRGNKKVNVQTLIDLGSFSTTASTTIDTTDPMSILEDDDDWDAYDREEQEDNRAISSVSKVTSIDDAKDMKTYARIVIPLPKKKQVNEIDAILQRLLPVVQVMTKSIEGHKEKAKAAYELKEKREAIKEKKKLMTNEVKKRRNGYYY